MEYSNSFVALKGKNLYNETMNEMNEQTGIRINKYLSDAGICSRREADRLIAEGKVIVEGVTAVSGQKVFPGEKVCVDGKEVAQEEKKVLLLFHKPRGIVCSTKQQRDEITVTEFLKYPLRIYPVGRLDKESEGLLLMTNQGDLVNRIMRAGNYHEKEYLVTVHKPIDEQFLKQMAGGVPILDTITRPCFVERTGKQSFRIILTQGLNRQIRRMCEYLGYQVTSLKRVRIMNLELSGIEKGAYREITEKEWNTLSRLIESSSSETVIETGGLHGDSRKGNKRAGSTSERSGKGVLPGRQRNHEQSGVRQTVRQTGRTGERNRDRSGKQSDRNRRV